MNIRNFEKFKLSPSGYIYVSKKTRKIFAISLHDEDFRLVCDEDKEVDLLIKGLLLNGQLYYLNSFYSLIQYVNKEDPFVKESLLALRYCIKNNILCDLIREYLA